MSTSERKVLDVTLRPRRQITLPDQVCRWLGLEVGDQLEVTVEGATLIGRPRKAIGLEALREIQEAFARVGLGEEELQEAGRQVREQLLKERYGEEG